VHPGSHRRAAPGRRTSLGPVTAPPLVTLHVWGVPRRAVPTALLRMATDRHALRRTPGLSFAKLLGTGSGRTFTVRDADPRHWALVAVWSDEAAAAAFERGDVVRRWRRTAEEEWTARLRPLATRGQWSRREPFGRPQPQRWDGPVAAVTRARLVPRRAVGFWRAVPPVSADLHDVQRVGVRRGAERLRLRPARARRRRPPDRGGGLVRRGAVRPVRRAVQRRHRRRAGPAGVLGCVMVLEHAPLPVAPDRRAERHR
jgi:hypothetical protein